MAAGSLQFLVCFIFFSICFLHLSHSTGASPLSSQPGENTYQSSAVASLRRKREVCGYGVYQHEGRNCCLCGAGERLIKHCTTNPNDGKCVDCEKGKYNSHANYRDTCERCTSCNQPNANLEEAEECTRARDAVCRCKANHYCNGQNCQVCQPCKECGPAGIKEPCNATSDTVCKDAVKEENPVTSWAIPVAVVVVVVVVVAAAVGFICWRKRKQRRLEEISPPRNEGERDMEMQRLNGVELRPFLSDILNVLTWTDVNDIAERCNITQAAIESCQLNHPGNIDEQKRELLKKFEEKEGRSAANTLIKMLHRASQKGKAEKVTEILNKS